jgi:hypothetical protein
VILVNLGDKPPAGFDQLGRVSELRLASNKPSPRAIFPASGFSEVHAVWR